MVQAPKRVSNSGTADSDGSGAAQAGCERGPRVNACTSDTLLDSIGAGVAIIDERTHVIEQVNATACNLIGLPAEQIVGRSCYRLICGYDEGTCPVTDLGQEVNNAESILPRPDGHPMPILKSVKRICLEGKEKLVETLVNISKRKEAEQALRESERRMRALIASMNDQRQSRVFAGVFFRKAF
jgi:PAS domain S-box-containing protein